MGTVTSGMGALLFIALLILGIHNVSNNWSAKNKIIKSVTDENASLKEEIALLTKTIEAINKGKN